MSKNELIREAARKLRAAVLREMSQADQVTVSPSRLVELTTKHIGIELIGTNPEAALLRGSKAVQIDKTVIFDASLADGYKEYCIVHEIGHVILHTESNRNDCDATDFEMMPIDDGNDFDPAFGYGPKMLKEREANLFALEFLVPTDKIAAPFLEKTQKPFSSLYEDLKSSTGQSDSFLVSQLSRAILLRPANHAEGEAKSEKPSTPPNESQRRAAEIEKGPLLLVAGPGTGKTKTLIERIIFLLKQGNDPSSILALTFSAKATEEIQKRVEDFDPEAALKISVYNFHSFALELLRKYWKEAGLSQNPKIVSRLDAILQLEKEYENLELEALENFYNPTQTLLHVLNFISRLQDELISPIDLEKIILHDEALLKTDSNLHNDREAHEARSIAIKKQREALRVYQRYFEFLNETQALDYGEMIFRCVRLLNEHPKVLEDVRRRFKHILVDEFQDVNRASGVFLKRLAGDGDGLWAVGDIRQAIYRWRGASPENIEKFPEEYPEASQLQLDVNYRSARKIVDLFSSFATEMQVGKGQEKVQWETSSDEDSDVRYRIFSNKTDEYSSIAAEIRDNIARGKRFSDHAVIARSKSTLLKLSKNLEEQRIPILFLGAVFEREEVRDLLCLLDIRSSSEGNGLLRVSKLEEFNIPEEDVKHILSTINTEDNNFQAFITGSSEPEKLSGPGREGLKRLREFLSRNPRDISAYEFLGRILFREGLVLRSRLQSYDEIRTPQELLAIHQLLSLSQSVEASFKEFGENQIEKFLDHLRLLIEIEEHHDFSRIPESLSKYDAVKILTVHGSKGLEFDSVFIPNLTNKSFPSIDRSRPGEIPLPLPIAEKTLNHHKDEEECLFFVAISRAKRQLFLSRSELGEKGGKIGESSFIGLIKPALDPEIHKSTRDQQTVITSGKGVEKTSLHFSWIEDYRRCPRQFFYKRVMEADGKISVSPYQRYRSAIRETLGDLKRSRKPSELDAKHALTLLEEYFLKLEIDNHPNAKSYKKHAREIIESFCVEVSQFPGDFYTHSLTCKLDNGQVYFYPDLMIVEEDLIRIIKMEFKDKPKTKIGYDKIGDAIFLMADAALTELRKSAIKTSILYLPSGESHDFEANEKLRSKRKEKAVRDIDLIRNGYFEASPDPTNCNRCKYIFPCPS